jgi:plasmid maintenance system killer protein
VDRLDQCARPDDVEQARRARFDRVDADTKGHERIRLNDRFKNL